MKEQYNKTKACCRTTWNLYSLKYLGEFFAVFRLLKDTNQHRIGRKTIQITNHQVCQSGAGSWTLGYCISSSIFFCSTVCTNMKVVNICILQPEDLHLLLVVSAIQEKLWSLWTGFFTWQYMISNIIINYQVQYVNSTFVNLRIDLKRPIICSFRPEQ